MILDVNKLVQAFANVGPWGGLLSNYIEGSQELQDAKNYSHRDANDTDHDACNCPRIKAALFRTSAGTADV